MTSFFSSLAVFIYGRLEKYLVQYVNELTLKTETLNKSNSQFAREIEERELTEYQLTLSEIKFRNVFNIISDGISLLNHNYKIIDMNDGMVKMTGLSKERLKDRPFDSLFTNTKKLKNILGKKHFHSTIFNNNEHQVKTLDKHVKIPVEINLHPFQLDPEIMYVALLKDVTYAKENETKIMNAVISSEEEERLGLPVNCMIAWDHILPLQGCISSLWSSLKIKGQYKSKKN